MVKKRVPIPNPVRERIAQEQSWSCFDCKTPLHAGYEIDHRTRRDDGGTYNRTNLAALCGGCHSQKTNEERYEKAVARLNIVPTVRPTKKDSKPKQLDEASFRELLALLKEEKLGYAMISRRFGVSRAYVQNISKQYFPDRQPASKGGRPSLHAHLGIHPAPLAPLEE